jgi:hypothetical protein
MLSLLCAYVGIACLCGCILNEVLHFGGDQDNFTRPSDVAVLPSLIALTIDCYADFRRPACVVGVGLTVVRWLGLSAPGDEGKRIDDDEQAISFPIF